MSSSDGLQPRDSHGDFSPAAGAGLNALNMTQVVQSNVLLPSTLQNLVTTQQQLSLLSSQMTGAGGKVGSMSSYGNYQQPVLQQQSGSVTELPPNTTSPHHHIFRLFYIICPTWIISASDRIFMDRSTPGRV
jgi:hypothetical protein